MKIQKIFFIFDSARYAEGVLRRIFIVFKTSAAAVDPPHLKVEVADSDFPNCSYVRNRTCQYPTLIM